MFIATMCGIAINCIYLFFKLKAWKYYKPKLVDLSLIKEVCGYSLPLVPNQISGWILSASDRTIIAKFLSVAENGVYSVANKFSNLVGTFYGFFNLAWVETVSVHYNDSDRDEFIGDMMETVSNLFVSICVGIIAIMPFVFPVMVNQQYGNAYYQIPILLIAVIFQILVGLYSAIYIALKKSSTIARTTIAGAIINVLVNLALIRFIGLYAASISTLVSYASTALYRRIDIRKYIKIKVNVKNILLNSVAVVFVTLSYYFNITILNVAALVIACIYAVGINGYTQLFYTNLPLRRSCGECPFSTIKRCGDFTVGDFWGVQDVLPEFDDNKGVSLLFFNNDRALERFDSFKEMLKYQEISVTDAVRQPNLKGHSVIPKNVNAFWRDFQKKGIGYCISFYSPAGIPFRIKRKIKYIYSKVTRK